MENDKLPSLVRVHEGRIIADSRDVAKAFEKRHAHVLRDIRELSCSDEFRRSNFGLNKYTKDLGDGINREYDYVEMTRDGFTFLAMGFAGAKAAAWKERYIEAFNRMEASLARPAAIDFSDPAVLLGCIQSLQAQVFEHGQTIAVMAPKAAAQARLSGADGSMCITDAAKTLGVSPIKNLFGFLQSIRWIYKRTGSANWIARQEVIVAGYMEHDDYLYRDDEGRDRVKTRALVTAKGLAKLAEMLGTDDRQGDLLQ
jgi:Rha family phage regulatory protein